MLLTSAVPLLVPVVVELPFCFIELCEVDLLSNSASKGIKSTPTLMLSLSAFSKKIEAKVTSLLMFLVVSVVPLLSISSFTVDLTSA